jgi:hypothetical protein
MKYPRLCRGIIIHTQKGDRRIFRFRLAALCDFVTANSLFTRRLDKRLILLWGIWYNKQNSRN